MIMHHNIFHINNQYNNNNIKYTIISHAHQSIVLVMEKPMIQVSFWCDANQGWSYFSFKNGFNNCIFLLHYLKIIELHLLLFTIFTIFSLNELRELTLEGAIFLWKLIFDLAICFLHYYNIFSTAYFLKLLNPFILD